jgi:hypothetical protein
VCRERPGANEDVQRASNVAGTLRGSYLSVTMRCRDQSTYHTHGSASDTKIGSEQEFDEHQAEIAFVGPAIPVHSAVCETAN